MLLLELNPEAVTSPLKFKFLLSFYKLISRVLE